MHLLPIPRSKILAVFFSLAVCLVDPALARDKTDVIVMKNGDRITGEVKNIENDVLQVDPDYVNGSISIDWRKVARLESDALFLVQLQDGAVYSAKVLSRGTHTSSSVIEIQPVGQEPLIVDKSTVVRMTETSESVLKRFSGNLTLGSTYSKGNTAAQYNIGSELDYIQTRWGGKANVSSNLSSSTGTAVSTRNQVDLAAYHLLHWRDYFYGGTADFLQSSVQGIQRQITVGGGLGRFLKNSDVVRLSVFGGLGWQRTSYIPTAQTQRLQELGVVLISSNLQVFRFKKTQLNVDASLAPALSQPGRFFSKINASYYVKIFGKFDWNLSFYGNWDTQPPAALPSSDYGTSTGFSWTFGNR